MPDDKQALIEAALAGYQESATSDELEEAAKGSPGPEGEQLLELEAPEITVSGPKSNNPGRLQFVIIGRRVDPETQQVSSEYDSYRGYAPIPDTDKATGQPLRTSLGAFVKLLNLSEHTYQPPLSRDDLEAIQAGVTGRRITALCEQEQADDGRRFGRIRRLLG